MSENKTSTGSRCSQCGADLPPNLPSHLCPKCLLKTGLDAQPKADPSGTLVVTPEQALPGLPRSGEQLGHYLVGRSLGGGGMGSVFEAEDLESGRRVALKVLTQGPHSPDARERFFREGRLAASINHPNCVYVFGTEEIGGVPLITMELIAGGTLEDRVRARGPMPAAEAVDAVLQIIAGLEAAQRVGILHRDIKPSNCFLDADGTVKIGDFGLSISTAVRTEPALTAAGTFLGTPAFCSPEQLRGEELNARSDIYSVGATLFYLLTGRTPFQARNVVALLATVLEQPAPSPGLFRPGLPRGLSKVVRRCLLKQPAERFGRYEELRRALAPYGSTAPDPATLGLRIAAGWADVFFLFLIAWIVAMVGPFHHLRISVGSHDAAVTVDTDTMLSRFNLLSAYDHPPVVLAFGLAAILVRVLYFALLEGYWGVTLGKLVFGLRVVGPDNNPPGFWRGLTRALLYVVTPALPGWLIYWRDPAGYFGGSPLSHALVGFSFYVPLALLFCTARRRNGFAAFHDLITKTRVVSRTSLHVRPAPVASETLPSRVETAPRIGPYHILQTLEESGGIAWRVGYDLRLLRKVWIRTVPAGTPAIPSQLRGLRRVGRLRWLSGQRSAELNWDAFEALSGRPLLQLPGDAPADAGDASNRQPWAQVRYWVSDLASELAAAQKDGTLPPQLTLDRVWITADGRAKLLDFPAPGLAASGGASTNLNGAIVPPDAVPSQPNQNAATRFLAQTAATALAGRSDGADPAPGKIPNPLPLHARKFLEALPGILDADAIQAAVRPLLSRVASVTRRRRLAILAGCAVFPLLAVVMGLVLVRMLVDWDKHNHGTFELAQLLRERSTMRRHAKNQAGPTDRQYAIYIAGHYRAAITNASSWSNAITLGMITGKERRFADDSLTQPPATNDTETAQSETAVKKIDVTTLSFDSLKVPSLALMILSATLAVYFAVPAIIAALAFRGGLILLAAGVTYVRRDGAPASRARLFWRALLTWAPILPAVPLSAAALSGKPAGYAVAIVATYSVLAVISVLLPERGLQDRLAGTWPVPR